MQRRGERRSNPRPRGSSRARRASRRGRSRRRPQNSSAASSRRSLPPFNPAFQAACITAASECRRDGFPRHGHGGRFGATFRVGHQDQRARGSVKALACRGGSCLSFATAPFNLRVHMSDSVPEAKPSLRERWTTPHDGVSASGGTCASPLGPVGVGVVRGRAQSACAADHDLYLRALFLRAPGRRSGHRARRCGATSTASRAHHRASSRRFWARSRTPAGGASLGSFVFSIALAATAIGAVVRAAGRGRALVRSRSACLLVATFVVVRLHRRLSQRDAADARAGEAGRRAVGAWRSRSAICRA